MPTLRLIAADPTLRLIALMLMAIGIINASLYPYQSLIAVERVGLSDGVYALVLLLAAGAAVLASLGAGIVTDQRANRRAIALATAGTLVIGPGMMAAAPGPVALVLCHGLMLPLSASLFGQCFALARLACADRPEHRDGVLSVLRAMLSLTFLLALLVWSFAFGFGLDVMAIYPLAALIGAGLFALVLRDWPRDGATRWADPPSGLGLAASLAEIARGPVLRPLACLGAITAAPALYMVLISLVFEEQAGRSASDVALFVGLVAGFEVPFMLLLPHALRHMRRLALIALGALLYAAYLALLPLVAHTPLVWALPVLAGLGGAAILTLPIAYLQDRMADRPGTGSSLMAVQKVISDTLCAGAFALGTALGGLGLTALIGAAITLLGAAFLLAADRTTPRAHPAPAR
jgi:predicted MFS family arabinose efflux permease